MLTRLIAYTGVTENLFSEIVHLILCYAPRRRWINTPFMHVNPIYVNIKILQMTVTLILPNLSHYLYLWQIYKWQYYLQPNMQIITF